MSDQIVANGTGETALKWGNHGHYSLRLKGLLLFFLDFSSCRTDNQRDYSLSMGFPKVQKLKLKHLGHRLSTCSMQSVSKGDYRIIQLFMETLCFIFTIPICFSVIFNLRMGNSVFDLCS